MELHAILTAETVRNIIRLWLVYNSILSIPKVFVTGEWMDLNWTTYYDGGNHQQLKSFNNLCMGLYKTSSIPRHATSLNNITLHVPTTAQSQHYTLISQNLTTHSQSASTALWLVLVGTSAGCYHCDQSLPDSSFVSCWALVGNDVPPSPCCDTDLRPWSTRGRLGI